MLHRLIRMWPACVLILASQAWAMGLGDIRLSSALNEPLRAEIELLTPTQDELRNLKIRLASAETFERYGLDRPVELMGLEFLVSSGPDGSVVRVTSAEPITEPFITFLVEAEWTRGRLLREYTLLLDPPTFAPAPVAQTTQPVAAPARSQPADSGAIARPPAQSRPAPQPPVTTPEPTPQPPVTTPRQDAPPQQETPPPAAPAPTFDTSGGGQYVVQRGDTLWQIADRFRPDNRLTMNQTMLGIFEANPEAFEGNINRLSSGATLRIPSADEIFRISRGEANREALRQNEVWASGTVTEDSRPSLTLIPPDEEPEDIVAVDEPPAEVEVPVDETTADAVPSDEQRIYEIEQLLLDHQDSIIEIDDDELAVLRAELARLRGEEYVPPAEVEAPDEADALPIEEEPVALEEEPVTEPEPEPAPPPQVTPVADQDSPGFFGSILASISGFWGILLGGLILALGTLLFFARRAAQQPDDDSTGVWNALDADEVDSESAAATQRLRALAQKDDSAIVVVEVDSKPPEEDADYDPSDTAAASSVELEPFTTETVAQPADELGADPSSFDTLEAPAASTDATVAPVDDSLEEMLDGQTEPVAEHTYSSDTAINFDQSDPIAEADFHMAYGLYDQAADLVNGALALEPNRQDLLGKLCEIYFVWGNRDAFIDAAGRLRGTIGEGESNPDWDRIVIMGQQIAGDNEMFSGVSAGAATKAVDLSLEGETDDAGVLDMDFAGGGPDGVVSDVIDLGDDDGGDESTVVAEDSMIDFVFDDDDLAVSATREMPGAMQADDTFDSPLDDLMAPESTAETPAVEQPSPDATLETPSMDDQFDSLDATGELASLTNIIGDNDATANPQDMIPPDATAEIELDDLGLDLGGLSDSELDQMAGDDDLDEFGETEVAPDLTGRSDFDHFAETAETPTLSEDLLGDDLDATAETPTISEEIVNDEFAATAETPTLSEDLGDTTETPTVSQEGPEVFAETAETPQFAGDEEVTGKNFALDEELVETGKNPEVDVSDLGDAAISTGVHGVPDFGASIDATGENAALELPDAHAQGADETMGAEPGMGIDASLLDATGQTQILSGEMAVEAERRAKEALADDDETMQAPPPADDDATVLAPHSGDDEETVLAPPRADDEETLLAPPRGDDEETLLAPPPVEDVETMQAPMMDAADTLTPPDIDVASATPMSSSDAETILAPLDDDGSDFGDLQFSKTEALPKQIFTEPLPTDETSEIPSAAGSTDMDLDLEDLTAALRVSEMQDYIDASEDETVEQPVAPGGEPIAGDFTGGDAGGFGADDDLQDARTMTEVGTKLDLARAYVDMGDPDGARSILEEVLDEGDDGQRQQAQQLLDALPG